MEGLLVVLGATGTQGGSVIDHVLQQSPKAQIRGVTRNTSSTTSLALRERGIEMVQADMEDCASLTMALKVSPSVSRHDVLQVAEHITQGASFIFAATDYWEPFINYLQSGRSDKWQQAEADEVRCGKNIVDAACQTLDTLEHFVFSSLPSPDAISNHTFSNLYHFEGKVKIVRYIGEKGLQCPTGKRVCDNDFGEEFAESKQLRDVTTVLWCGCYMENFQRWDLNSYLVPKDNGEGKFVMSTRAHPSTPMEFLACGKDVGLFVTAVLQRQPQGVDGTPVIASPASMTLEDACAALGQLTGRNILYQQSAVEEMAKGSPIGAVFERMYEFYNTYGWSGGVKAVGREDIGLSGKTSTFESFVGEHNWDGFFVKTDD
ncbi:uncharacterized protein LTR77_007225 [Saxophila tyrrhenica]|uniref:NmrA-like domain-containing protein n=1 Tax=Saxophila tyrrhenica TaxID=1690608 RepID=A0AAV9P620_9PEZI|nr:hypothetical protein LTR77_007225 [Saxophila tyrrhenica]